MVGLEIHQEERAGRLTLRLTGTLDNQTALLLRQSLDTLGSREVELDFTHLREFRNLKAQRSRELTRREAQKKPVNGPG